MGLFSVRVRARARARARGRLRVRVREPRWAYSRRGASPDGRYREI
jgi:hypothetical protein